METLSKVKFFFSPLYADDLQCIKSYHRVLGRLDLGDVINATLFCVIDHLIELKANSFDMLPISFVKDMQENAIEVLHSLYPNFNEYIQDAFRDTLNEKIYEPSIINETHKFIKILNLNR